MRVDIDNLANCIDAELQQVGGRLMTDLDLDATHAEATTNRELVWTAAMVGVAEQLQELVSILKEVHGLD